MMGNRAMVQPLTNNTTNQTDLGGVNITVYGAPGSGRAGAGGYHHG